MSTSRQVAVSIIGAFACAVAALLLQGATRWFLWALFGVLILSAVYLVIAKPTAAPESMAEHWKKLAADFEVLGHDKNNYTVAHWNSEAVDTGEQWVIGYDDHRKCEALCSLAGALLLKSPKISATLSEKVKTRSNDSWKWLYYLKENHRGFNLTTRGISSARGFNVETEGGTIEHLPAVSASVCIECAAREL